MKGKILYISAIIALMAVMGCSKSPEQGNEQSNSAISRPKTEITKENKTPKVDNDLTELSGIMAYSQVSNILNNPEEYYGKTMRIKGKFNMQTDEVTGNTYYFCIIADATECCAEGMEFTPADKSIQLPDIDREITVTGVFDLYEDNGYKFFHIADVVIE